MSNDQIIFDALAAEQAAKDGMTQALRAERVELWKQAADAWLAEKPFGLVFVADHLVEAIGLPDVGPGRNNVVGAWVSAQARLGRIRFTGTMTKSQRVVRHGNLQRVWRVVE